MLDLYHKLLSSKHRTSSRSVFVRLARGHLPEHLPPLPRHLRHAPHQREPGGKGQRLEARRSLRCPQSLRQ